MDKSNFTLNVDLYCGISHSITSITFIIHAFTAECSCFIPFSLGHLQWQKALKKLCIVNGFSLHA